MSPTDLVLLSVPALILLLLAGLPVYASLGIMGLGGTMFLTSPTVGLALLQETPYSMMAVYLYLVIPLFIFMGHLAFSAGITEHAFDIGRKWLSKFPAGLALSTIVACGVMGAACGSSVAASATMGQIALPEMIKSGYDKKLACGCVAAGGLLSIIIPPSVVLVLYAIITDNSVGACLIGGLIPGIISTIVFMAGMAVLIRKNPDKEHVSVSYTWREKFGSLKGAWGVAVLFIIVIGGMYSGVFTPTEAAAGGAFGAFIMMMARTKARDWGGNLKEALEETVKTSVFIFMIMTCAGIYSNFLIRAGVGEALSNWIVSIHVSPMVVVLLVLAMYIPLGCFLDPASCLLITLPIVYPIVVKQLGFNPIWFAVLVTKLIEIGLITPPVGLNVYTIGGVAPDVPLYDVFKGASWFILFELVTLAILMTFPVLVTWLPGMMMGPS